LTERLRGRLTELRPATEADVEVLVAWHRDPEVARYWDGKSYTPEEMRDRLARPHVDGYVVEAEGRPVGYLQAWRGEADSGGSTCSWYRLPAAAATDPMRLERWRSTLAAEGRTPLTVDPYLWNERAIAAWREAGFEPVDERPPDDEHSAPWMLMEWRS
jgi:aminoglycoside 6'-N-acetyltransferase